MSRAGMASQDQEIIKLESEEGLAARAGTNNFKTSSPRDPESQPGNNNVD
jgi:hypothetical protein